MNKRTVIVIDVFVTLQRFEQLIRDYNIHYLVESRDAFGWREFEMQMALTNRYSFQEEYSTGYFSVYSIHPSEKEGLPRNSFDALLKMIKRGEFRTVDSVYHLNKEIMDSHIHLIFLEAIAKEALGQLDSAWLMMEKLYTLPQGIVYSQEAGLHRELIEWRRQLGSTTDRYTRNAAVERSRLEILGMRFALDGTLVCASKYCCGQRFCSPVFLRDCIFACYGGHERGKRIFNSPET